MSPDLQIERHHRGCAWSWRLVCQSGGPSLVGTYSGELFVTDVPVLAGSVKKGGGAPRIKVSVFFAYPSAMVYFFFTILIM